jgi:hypothetical protein
VPQAVPARLPALRTWCFQVWWHAAQSWRFVVSWKKRFGVAAGKQEAA